MSAAGDRPQHPNIFLGVERRRVDHFGSRVRSLIPSPFQIDAKRLEKQWLCTRRSSLCREKRVASEALLFVPALFRTETVLTVLHRNDRAWAAYRPCTLGAQSSRSACNSLPRPELHGLGRSAAIIIMLAPFFFTWFCSYFYFYVAMSWIKKRKRKKSCLLKGWMNRRMRWNTPGIDHENVLARSERVCRWFWNETWNL